MERRFPSVKGLLASVPARQNGTRSSPFISNPMATRIDTVSARDRLPPRRDPYWQRISKGYYLGVRKMAKESECTWLARAHDEASGKQVYMTLGTLQELPSHQRFDAAVKAAQAWFEHLGRGGSHDTSITVKTVCEEYVQALRASGRPDAAKDAEGRFKRWIYGNARFSGTPLLKLTPKALADWRAALQATKALPQDKAKPATRERSASTLNRDMSTLRAALNLALENGHVPTDAAWRVKLKPVKAADRRRDVYLDRAQRQSWIAAAPDDLRPFMRALAMIPLRPGAMAALTAGNFDKRLSTLTIGKDKAGADRRITLPPAIAAFFTELGANKLPKAFLFTRADGKPWNSTS